MPLLSLFSLFLVYVILTVFANHAQKFEWPSKRMSYAKPSQSAEGGDLRQVDVPLFAIPAFDRIAGLYKQTLYL
jgi:hypothetical protein